MVKQDRTIYQNNKKRRELEIKKKQKELFKEIKNKFTEKLILKIYRLKLPIKVKTDLLDFILKAYMIQKYEDKI